MKQSKNKNIKKIVATLCLLAITFFYQNTNAQVTLGGGLAYGSKISTAGVHITGQLFITENIAIAPAFTYFFPSTAGFIIGYKRKWYEGSLDVNYYPNLEILEGKLKTYGLAGANYSVISFPRIFINNDYTKSKFGLNLGAGAEYDFGKSITPFLQLKHTIGFDTYSQTQIAAGVRFEF